MATQGICCNFAPRKIIIPAERKPTIQPEQTHKRAKGSNAIPIENKLTPKKR